MNQNIVPIKIIWTPILTNSILFYSEIMNFSTISVMGKNIRKGSGVFSLAIGILHIPHWRPEFDSSSSLQSPAGATSIDGLSKWVHLICESWVVFPAPGGRCLWPSQHCCRHPGSEKAYMPSVCLSLSSK